MDISRSWNCSGPIFRDYILRASDTNSSRRGRVHFGWMSSIAFRKQQEDPQGESKSESDNNIAVLIATTNRQCRSKSLSMPCYYLPAVVDLVKDEYSSSSLPRGRNLTRPAPRLGEGGWDWNGNDGMSVWTLFFCVVWEYYGRSELAKALGPCYPC